MPQNSFDKKFNIGSSYGLMPSGNKRLPEPMLTQIYISTWRHKATNVKARNEYCCFVPFTR